LLKEDFPATAAVIGDLAFEDLIRAYLTRHPPTEPSIFYAGRHLADFLADHGLRQRWPFLAELARLERTLIEVFHSPDAPILSASEMNSFYPEDWSALRLHSHPALRLLDSRWRVNDVLRAVEDGGQWEATGTRTGASVGLAAGRPGLLSGVGSAGARGA
jgi:Putative DNA-binding domain